MKYVSYYESKLGKITIASNESKIIGIWFSNQKYYGNTIKNDSVLAIETDVIKKTKKWLDIYFSGVEPSFDIPIEFIGTNFQISVWNVLKSIPYGKTLSYKEVLLLAMGSKYRCYQAVGAAISKNPISIVVPCHRVIGAYGNITGYAGGINRKEYLLNLERGN